MEHSSPKPGLLHLCQGQHQISPCLEFADLEGFHGWSWLCWKDLPTVAASIGWILDGYLPLHFSCIALLHSWLRGQMWEVPLLSCSFGYVSARRVADCFWCLEIGVNSHWCLQVGHLWIFFWIIMCRILHWVHLVAIDFQQDPEDSVLSEISSAPFHWHHAWDLRYQAK